MAFLNLEGRNVAFLNLEGRNVAFLNLEEGDLSRSRRR